MSPDNSFHTDYAIARGKSLGGIFCTYTHSSHAFRKRVRLLPIRQKTIEMTTLQQKRNSLNLDLRTIEEVMGHLAVATIGYHSSLVG